MDVRNTDRVVFEIHGHHCFFLGDPATKRLVEKMAVQDIVAIPDTQVVWGSAELKRPPFEQWRPVPEDVDIESLEDGYWWTEDLDALRASCLARGVSPTVHMKDWLNLSGLSLRGGKLHVRAECSQYEAVTTWSPTMHIALINLLWHVCSTVAPVVRSQHTTKPMQPDNNG